MKVLLDECLPQRLRHDLPGHEVISVAYAGLSGVKNDALLAAAADQGFDVLLTTDRGIPFEHNPDSLPWQC